MVIQASQQVLNDICKKIKMNFTNKAWSVHFNEIIFI